MTTAQVDTTSSARTYADRLAANSRRTGSVLCAGIDPSPEAIALITTGSGFSETGSIERFAGLVIESVRDVAAAVKFQIAWFERRGADGIRALERSIAYARNAGLIIIVDAKRGDVPHSAAAYADAWLGEHAPSGCGADALTVHATVGRDALEAMATVAHQRNCQLYALVHTSNPGAASLQSQFWRDIAVMVDEIGLGAVVGATQTDVLREARSLMPHAPFLLPGIGAQGGSIDDLLPVTPTSVDDAPILVSASRSLLPDEPAHVTGFRYEVATRAAALAASLEPLAHLR